MQTRGLSIIKDPETGRTIQPYQNSWAIIIGINDYEHIRPLDYAVADAKAVREMLIQNFNFPETNVTLLTDEQASQENIKEAFGDLSEVGKEDRVLIFFAGHGETLVLPTGDDMGFLIPSEGKNLSAGDLYSSSIPMSDINELSNLIPAKHVLFIVDACFSGLATVGTRSTDLDTQNYIRKITSARSRQIITAGGKDEVVFEGSEWGGHSAFTFKLLHGLKKGYADENEDGIILAQELGLYLEKEVSSITGEKQTPQFNSLTTDEGEFLFMLPSIRIPAEPTAPVVQYGDMYITSEPKGAQIFINGEPAGKTTPAEIHRLQAGKHKIELRSGKLFAEKIIEVTANVINKVNLDLKTATGVLRISSEPFEAEVYIDRKYVGATPVMLSEIPTGKHNVTLRKKGFLPHSKVISVAPFEQTNYSSRLLRPSSLNIKSTPSGAHVYLNGELKGRTPLLADQLQPGSYDIRIEAADHDEWEREVSVEEGTTEVINADLQFSYGWFTVIPDPSDAEIIIDGERISTGTLKDHKLPPGWYPVTVRKEDYKTKTEWMQIRREQKTELKVNLAFNVGYVSMSAFKPDADIYIDGRRIASGTVVSHKVPAGTRNVEVRHPSLSKPVTYQLNVQPAQTSYLRMRREFTMDPFVTSLLLPGVGQISNHSTGRGLFFLLGTAAAGGFASNRHNKFIEADNSYKAAIAAYEDADTPEEAANRYQEVFRRYDKMKDKHRLYEASLIAVGSIYALNLLDALIFQSKVMRIEETGKRKTGLRPSVSFNGNGIQYGIKMNF